MADPRDWGPPLWRLLHTCAEKLGVHTNRLLVADEQRAWIQLLRSIEHVLPCVKCQVHFRAWKRVHHLELFAQRQGDDLRRAAREWLWALHEEVNTERGVTGGCAVSDLPTLYGSRPAAALQADLRDVIRYLSAAVESRHIPAEAFRTFRRAVGLLLRFTA